MEPVDPVQVKIYQSNDYRKDLTWLHFDNEPRVPEKQQVKNQQFYISIFVANPTIPSSNCEHQPRHDNSFMHRHMVDLQRHRATSEERNFIQQIKAPIFLEAILAIEIM